MTLQLTDIILLLFVSGLVTLWWHGKAVKELALVQVKQKCQAMDLQLLDDTISIHHTFPIWDRGQLNIKRVFKFEFTATGISRYTGTVQYIGKRMNTIHFEVHQI
ncbi:DUF3301 domain-containing protein [Marinomonas agarivorans]|nr:DUF3301 domain-containing protein [Marinomonas agarivorans]